MNIHNIDNVTIPFDPKWKNIAVSVSGGADSALLTYLLCNIAPVETRFHIISNIRMWKTRPWQSEDSKRIFDFFVDRFPERTFYRHTNFIAPDIEYGNIGPSLTDEYGMKVSGDNIQIRAFAEYTCYYNNIEGYYNAVTCNPPDVEFGGMLERDLKNIKGKNHLEHMIHLGIHVMHPFRFTDKSWIVKQYKRLNIMNLFNITRSCEGEFEDLNFRTYVPGQYVPTCGECFWCKERDWAIEQNK